MNGYTYRCVVTGTCDPTAISNPATLNVRPKSVTVSFTVSDKVYDGGTSATISGRSITSGVVSGETVTLTGGSATFADKNVNPVGSPKTVSATGFTLDGATKDNYTVGTVATTTANITALGVTVSAVTDSKTYNGSTASAGTPTGGDLLTGDTYTSTGTQVFDSKNAGPRTLTASGAASMMATMGLTTPSATQQLVAASLHGA
jgi:hypothetical protein